MSVLYYDIFYFSMSGVLTLFALVCYIPLLKAKGILKYYIIIGSAAFLIFSIVALIESRFHLFSNQVGTKLYVSIFYIGVIFENMLFSLGLGHKQRLILLEKNRSDQKLILQLKENEILKDKIQLQLKEDVKALSKTIKIKELEAIKTKYEKDLTELKLDSLRSQMNPHFIFNSLNSIKGFIIDNEQENAVFYLNKFSKLIRMILSSSMEKNISLAQEIEIAELYVNVENIRFNNEIDFTLNIDKELSINTIKVPALLFQPFLENAIWHGLAAKKGEKELLFSLVKKNEILEVTIKDNGIGRKKSSEFRKKKLMKRESYGMKLTEDRLESFVASNQGKYQLTIEDLYNEKGDAIGTLVKVQLPIVLT